MDELLKQLPALGVGGLLAYVIYMQSEKRTAEYVKKVEEFTTNWRGQAEILAGIIERNTTVQAANGILIKGLHDHLVMRAELPERRKEDRRDK